MRDLAEGVREDLAVEEGLLDLGPAGGVDDGEDDDAEEDGGADQSDRDAAAALRRRA